MRRLASRLLVLLMLSGFLVQIPVVTAHAADTVTKVINVKSVAGANYQNALVKAIYIDKLTYTYGESSLGTTDASGNVTLTYPSQLDYGYLVIQPPVSDTTNAVAVVQNIHLVTSTTFNVRLKKADLQINILNSDGSNAALGTEFAIAGVYFQTIRSGKFGISGDDLVLSSKGNLLTATPGAGVFGEFLNVQYFSANKIDAIWSIKVYSDISKTAEVLPVAGVQIIKFRKNSVQVNLKNSDNSALTIPTQASIYGQVGRVDADGNEIYEDSFDNSVSAFSTNGVWTAALGRSGRYPWSVKTSNTDQIPSFLFGNLWSNGTGLVSKTSATTGFPETNQVLSIDVPLPSTFLSFNLKDRVTNTLVMVSANLQKKEGNSYSSSTGFISNLYSENGKSAIALPDGDYKITFYAEVQSQYYLSVVSGVYTVKDSANQVVTPTNGTYIFYSGVPNLKMKATVNGVPLVGSQTTLRRLSDDQEYYVGSDGLGLMRTKLTDGDYELLLLPLGDESPRQGPNAYLIKIASGLVSEFKEALTNTAVAADSNGFYPVSLTTPRVTGTVTLTGSTFPAGAGFLLTPYKFDATDIKQKLKVARPQNIPINELGEFATNLDPATYKFRIYSSLANSKILTTDSQCIVLVSQAMNCPIVLPAENLAFTVKSTAGELLRSDLGVQVDFNSTETGFISTSVSPDPATGLISGRLINGDYQLRLTPYYPESKVGSSKSFKFTVENQVVTRMMDVTADQEVVAVNGVYPLYLQTSNFSGILKDAGVAVGSAQVFARDIYGRGESSSTSSNSEGKFDLFLVDGDNEVTVTPRGNENPVKIQQTYRVVMRNGLVVSVKNAVGVDVVAVDGIYTFGFEVPNVKGSISINGISTSGVVYAQKLDDSGKYFYWTNRYAIFSSSKAFALKLDPGKYTFQVYGGNQQSLSTDVCEVPISGDVICNTDFPSTNLKFNVSNNSGTKLASGFYTSLEFTTSSGALNNSCCTVAARNNSFEEATLLNGTHKITVNPDSTLPISNMSNFYTVTVAGGLVTSVLEGRSQTPISPDVDGTYSFRFISPGLSGTVVSYDGLTPAPNAQVQLVKDNNWFGTGSNQSGMFAIGYLVDGEYEMWAFPDYADISQFRSDIKTITVLNGLVSNQVIIQLNKPNVTGTVTGPTGIASKSNWVNVRKLDSNGYYQYIDKMQGRSTNGTGKFSYYLSPGTYIFDTNNDVSALGVRTTSAPCVVLAGVDKVCDITLASANLKFDVINSANISLPYSTGYFWLLDKNGTVSVRDGWMNIDGSGRGEFYLENGTWQLKIDPPYNNSTSSAAWYQVTVATGQVTQITDASGTVLTPVDGIYKFQLPSGNLVGSIKVGETKTNLWNWVTVKAWNGSNYNEIMGRGFQEGSFGFKVEPGLYKVESRPNAGASSNLSTSRSAVCEVFETGITTCDVTLRVGNLLGTVKTPSGNDFREVYGYLFSVNDRGEEWYQSINFYDAKFATYLEDGNYHLAVEPYWEKRSLYPRQDYIITVVSGIVTTVVNRNSLAVLTAGSDGRFSFILSAPSVAGFVYMPGDSTDKVPNIQVNVIDSTSKERWEFSTNTDATGKFGLNLPEGTYTLYARTTTKGNLYTNSAKVQITVAGGVVAGGDITLRLRAPNVFGVIVKPGGTEPLSQVNVNMYMDGEYAYTYTDSDGGFGAYFENAVSNPGSSYQIYLNHNNTADYSSKLYNFSTYGNLGNLAVGGVNSRVTVLYPETSGTSPSKWGYVAIEELVESNYIWQPGSSTDQLGKAGLSLTAGRSYRITAYPGWERGADFVSKSILISNFDPSKSEDTALTITFARPNISFFVKDRSGRANSWGWYQVNKKIGDNYQYFLNGYLNEQGRGSQSLSDPGDYQITFWPGKAAGISTTMSYSVSADGVVSLSGGSAITATTTITLPAGNVSGRVLSAPNVVVAGATVAAVSVSDPAKIVSTVALADGTFELGLDLTIEWNINALDPQTGKRSVLNVPLDTSRASNTILAVGDMTVAVATP